jgi:propanol-preferring alcohol dehydrogenase
LLSIDYGRDLWLEREIKSVANVTRRDVRGFLDVAAAIPIRPHVSTFPLDEANEAIAALANGDRRGAIVLAV